MSTPLYLSNKCPNIVTRVCFLAGLKQALIVSAYLTLLTFPIAQSAPTIRKPMSSREKSDPKWLNPCGMGSLNGAAPEHRMPDSKLIEQIASIAQIAESKAKTFQIDFVSGFGVIIAALQCKRLR